ncbi:MAG: primosomal protein N' [Candidatus Falkowbacteria bacterium]
MFVNIIPLTKLPLSKPQSYTYSADGFIDDLKIGQIVEAPLHNRQTLGIVNNITSTVPDVYNQSGKKIVYKKITKILDEHSFVNEHDLQLITFAHQYYYASLGLFLKHAIPEPLKRKNKKAEKALEQCDLKKINPPKATTLPQKNSVSGQAFRRAGENISQPVLITGTAQERQVYYLKIIKRAIINQKQILLLVPEITLLAQTKIWLENALPEIEVIVLFGGLSKTDQIINWRRAQTNSAQIFIGTRKAIFTPFYNLDCVIIDEEADLSYKQWDMNPRYDARLLAEKKAKLYGSKLIFGNTVPSITSYLKTKKKIFKHLSFSVATDTEINIVDMRNELHKGNYSVFSDKLDHDLTETLLNNKQTLIFTNRRAASTFVMCRDCGQVMRCPNCQIALVEHTNKTLSCNHCSVKMTSPLVCPKCKSPRIKSFGAGIEKVEEYIKEHFPQTKTQRMDITESTNFKNLLTIIKQWQAGEFDILIGTQISIRLQAPKLALIAAVDIDSVLNFPDWRNDEKAWQILNSLTQRDGQQKVLLQTYNPESALLQYIKPYVSSPEAEQQPIASNFYQQELHNRKQLSYPPFVKMIKLICKHDDLDFLQNETERIVYELRQALSEQKIIGPIQPINAKIRNFWQKHIIIKLDPKLTDSHKNDILKKILDNLNNAWSVDVDPLT